MTAIWNTRNQAETSLAYNLRPFADLFDELFSITDECLIRLDRENESFGRVCGLVLAKSRNLVIGCYSLSLDALAQEAGALFRPLLECVELLTYFRIDPTRIDEVIENRLPKAGVIAQRIEGKFKGLRDYLNTHASHLSISPQSMAHLIDTQVGSFRPIQQHNEDVLRKNLRTLLAVFVWLSIEAVNCVSTSDGQIDQSLIDQAEDIRNRASSLFGYPNKLDE